MTLEFLEIQLLITKNQTVVNKGVFTSCKLNEK